MRFLAYSKSAADAVARFKSIIETSQTVEFQTLNHRISLCPYDVIVIDWGEINNDGLGDVEYEQKVVTLQSEWQHIQKLNSQSERFQIAKKRILEIGEPQFFSNNRHENGNEMISDLRLLRFVTNNSHRSCFVLFLKGHEQMGLSAYHLGLLAGLYQLEQGGLPVHTAGIVREDKIFLFAGPSGAGKSTISALSKEQGFFILDEDQVLIRRGENDDFKLFAWMYGVGSFAPKEIYMFFIKQDTVNYLLPLSQTQTAYNLFKRHQDVLIGLLSQELYLRSFKIACELARSIRGFELHFRKSPDFWKLINEQLLG